MGGGAGTEETLAEMPRLGALYSRALGRYASLVLARPPRTSGAWAGTYRVDGVRADPEQLAAYQRLLGEPGTDVLPAGYVHVLAFPLAMAVMVRPDFPLPVLGLVHVGNRVVVHRPVHLDEVLTVRAHAEGLRGHRAGTQVDLVVEVSAGTEVVWHGTSTYLAKGRTVPGADPAPSPQAAPEDRAPGTGGPGTGAHVTTGVWRLGPDVGRDYAEVSGDRNPIHVSRVGARLFGFPRPIAHGMYTAARALAAVGAARGDAFVWEVAFAKPVLLPGTVTLSVDRDGDAYHYRGANRSGKVHFTGTVTPRGRAG